MKVISIVSQKGGSGKTTTAINLAVSHGGSTALLDLDPQASAAKWKDRRSAGNPAVVALPSSRLEAALEAAKQGGAEWTLIDTAPHSERDALAAARAADFVLVPCRPGILDLDALLTTAELIRLAKANAAAVLTGCPATGSLTMEAARVVERMGLELCPARLGYRAAFTHSLTGGMGAEEFEPGGKAAQETRRLVKWLRRKLA